MGGEGNVWNWLWKVQFALKQKIDAAAHGAISGRVNQRSLVWDKAEIKD